MPITWKYCWAILRCSLEPVAWPIDALTTPMVCMAKGRLQNTSSVKRGGA